MITIYFYYYSKSEGQTKSGEKEFSNVYKAARFCWKMKNQSVIIKGWECDYPEDNEYLSQNVNLAVINGWLSRY